MKQQQAKPAVPHVEQWFVAEDWILARAFKHSCLSPRDPRPFWAWASTRPELTASQTLSGLMMLLRGGRATCCQVAGDRAEWEKQFGRPGKKRIAAWLAGLLDVELAIPLAALAAGHWERREAELRGRP